ncbi:unnamed protein product [Trifolium pratense]|uniref:Uncharacterized protein n=2 Tax=Trifolium pratense TaxID=57577 RepID=A0ACB0KMZ5_TRIPR|nr:unnamed protein product [Trifolium pratense]CAJ2658605.1 unnamed protein product [Trifolium pratense]
MKFRGHCNGRSFCDFKKNPRGVSRLIVDKSNLRVFRKTPSLYGKYCCYDHWIEVTTNRVHVPYIPPPRTASQPSDIQVSDDAALKKKIEIDVVAADSSSSKAATLFDLSSDHQLVKCSTSATSAADDGAAAAAAAEDSVKASSKKKRKKKKKKSTEMAADSSSSKPASVLDLSSAHSESHHQLVKCSTFTDDGAAVDSVKATVRPKHGSSQFRKKKKQKLNN